MSHEELLHADTAQEWAAWLEANHATSTGVWLVTYRPSTGKPAPAYEETIREALRYGWIDSTARRFDDERTMLRFSPRRKGSGWARTNKERVARLEAEGRMTPAGQAVVDAARADGSWTLLDTVEALEVPDDLAAAFDAHPGAREHWEAFPASVKRSALLWIVQAKRPDTRARRIREVAEKTARSERPVV